MDRRKKGLNLGSWDWTLASGTARLDGVVADLYGVESGAIVSAEAFPTYWKRIVPEDWSRMERQLGQAKDDGVAYADGYDIYDLGGRRRKLIVRTWTRSEYGLDKPTAVYGSIIDVTEMPALQAAITPADEAVDAILMARSRANDMEDNFLRYILDVGLLHLAQTSRVDIDPSRH